MIATLEGPTAGDVVSFVFNPQGGRLATGSHGGTAMLWDLATSKCTTTPEGHTACVGLRDGIVNLLLA